MDINFFIVLPFCANKIYVYFIGLSKNCQCMGQRKIPPKDIGGTKEKKK